MNLSNKAQKFVNAFSTFGWAAKVAAERTGNLRYLGGFGAVESFSGFGQKWEVESVEVSDLEERHVLSIFNGQDWVEVASYLRQYQEVA